MKLKPVLITLLIILGNAAHAELRFNCTFGVKENKRSLTVDGKPADGFTVYQSTSVQEFNWTDAKGVLATSPYTLKNASYNNNTITFDVVASNGLEYRVVALKFPVTSPTPPHIEPFKGVLTGTNLNLELTCERINYSTNKAI